MKLNKKNIKRLFNMDFKTLSDIAAKEFANRQNEKLNTYYDLGTNEALVFPEDDKPGLKLRPLKQRLFLNGKRINLELSAYLANGLENAIKVLEENKETEDIKNV